MTVGLRIPLEHPIPGQNGPVSLLELRRPTLGDIERFSATVQNGADLSDPLTALKIMVSLTADLSGLPPDAIEKLDHSEARAVLAEVTAFVERTAPNRKRRRKLSRITTIPKVRRRSKA